MCGVSGLISFRDHQSDQIDSTLKAMNRKLIHRGPDHQGIEKFSHGGFAHTRLAIIDLDERSNQPFFNNKKDLCITYNGEIYNYRELRKTFSDLGYQFRTSSDTEVILAGYELFGAEILNKLNGIYAFAIWDLQKRELLIARDPLGVKPLFFYFDRDKLIFGSEIKAIFCDPEVPRDFDSQELDHFFSFGYTGAQGTGYSHIKKLRPGFFIHFSSNGLSETQYHFWQFDQRRFQDKSEPQMIEEFSQQLVASVNMQTVADAPLTSFLSGGLDSSAIAWALSQSDQKDAIKLFTFGFSDKAFDESDTATTTAQHLGMHHSVLIGDQYFRDLPEKVSYFLEDPMADSSSLAVYLLCKETAASNYKVALSGDGADELLAGYPTYVATLLSNQLNRLGASSIFGILSPFVNLLPQGDSPYSLYQKVNRFLDYAPRSFPENHASWRTHFSGNLKAKLYSRDFLSQITTIDSPIYQYAEYASQGDGQTWLTQAQVMDLTYYLPNDMLVKVDRMSMAHGLEVRVPFLDKDFVSLCLSLPDQMRMKSSFAHFNKKYLLKAAMKHRLPSEVLSKPKQGFRVPLHSLLKKYWIDQLLDLFATHRHEGGQYLNYESVASLCQNFKNGAFDCSYELFDILMFLYWIHHGRNWDNPR